MHKVLILGGEGMLGGMVERVLSRDRCLLVKCSYREEKRGSIKFNIKNGIDELPKIFEHQKGFDYIINCIGITKNNINENDPKSMGRAILVNALFPQNLATIAQDFGARVIQISTDGVFVKDANSCLENYPSNCYDKYGKSKSLGEVVSPNFLNLRCSIVGPSPYLREGLFEWFLLLQKKAKVDGFLDQLWNGVTTLQFAKLCQILITDNYFDVVRTESPTHHFCPNEVVTKFELLQLFKSYFRPDIEIRPILSSSNSVSRILGTNFQKINEIFGCNYSMEHVIKELAKEILYHKQNNLDR